VQLLSPITYRSVVCRGRMAFRSVSSSTRQWSVMLKGWGGPFEWNAPAPYTNVEIAPLDAVSQYDRKRPSDGQGRCNQVLGEPNGGQNWKAGTIAPQPEG